MVVVRVEHEQYCVQLSGLVNQSGLSAGFTVGVGQWV